MALQRLPLPDGASEPPPIMGSTDRDQARVGRPSWRDRFPGWWPHVTAGILLVALLATGFLAYRLSGDLTSARATVASQRDELTSTNAQLDVANARSDDLNAQVGSLQAQVQHQQDCVSALREDTATAREIEHQQGVLHNLYAEGSKFDRAQRARDAALRAAALDYYNAYDAAWNGLYTSANAWVDRANSQIRVATTNLDKMNAQIDKINALNHRIEGMLSASGAALAACGTGATNAV